MTTTPDDEQDFEIELHILGSDQLQLRPVALNGSGDPTIIIALTGGEDGNTPTLDVTAAGIPGDSPAEVMRDLGQVLAMLGETIVEQAEGQEA